MLLKESLWIRDVLEKLELKSGQVVLNVASSDEKLRSLDQPFIDYYIFRLLRKKGLKILHWDQKPSEGVDIVCDFLSKAADVLIEKMEPVDVIICTSFLEHVHDRDAALKKMDRLMRQGSVLILSVPYLHFHHPDPIDTGYRPTHRELEGLFAPARYRLIDSAVIEEETPIPPRFILRHLKRFFQSLGIMAKIRKKQSIITVQKL